MSDITNASHSQMLREILEYGRSLTLCGGDIRFVETTLERLGKVYGAEEMNVFVISAAIIVTAFDDQGNEETQSIRITKKIGYDFEKLEALADLAAETYQNPMDIKEFSAKRKAIVAKDQDILVAYLGGILAAGGFAIFFGGGLIDGLIAAVVGIAFVYLTRHFRPYCPNDIVFNFFACFISGIIIHCFNQSIPGLMPDKITIGLIMLPIPGIPITNAVRDMLAGDIITGILRFVESVLITLGIAGGFIAAMTLVGV